jgi:hypothetical protein
MEKTLKLLFAIAALVAAGTYFYAEAWVPITNGRRVEECLVAAKGKYRERWIDYCKLDKKEIGTDGLCLLSSERVDQTQGRYSEERNDCYQHFPVR